MLNLAELIVQAKLAIAQSQDIDTLELIRVKHFGKNGIFSQKMKILKNMNSKERPVAGILVNQAKQEIQQALTNHQLNLKQIELNKKLTTEMLDVTLPGRRIENGGLHPISRIISRIEHFFCMMGFSIETGPEIEDEYHNFDALNIPAHHPARTDHDTFWLGTTRLLRTQTSSIQIRTMKLQQPPIRIIASGRVYRNDYDQTHTPMFHQMEGMIVDTNINFSNLKNILHNFLQNFFEKDLQIRFRPSYFPFTEPSAEVDVLGKHGQWLEVLGCGMVHPNLLHNVAIDPEIYSGFAFGMGIERLAMLSYGITDLRIFFENDLRFLKQFK
ncbi:phenylalanine--tRNA ligase subunit alpha [Candidatus Curculioniphilus buchneri]|uniref:phenylalanine--tRNA ligase subunit alpha n=1 Tax=Candidatus Curculioniphilus buchneri TaxID=690594 RepID=UPI00376F1AEC